MHRGIGRLASGGDVGVGGSGGGRSWPSGLACVLRAQVPQLGSGPGPWEKVPWRGHAGLSRAQARRASSRPRPDGVSEWFQRRPRWSASIVGRRIRLWLISRSAASPWRLSRRRPTGRVWPSDHQTFSKGDEPPRKVARGPSEQLTSRQNPPTSVRHVLGRRRARRRRTANISVRT